MNLILIELRENPKVMPNSLAQLMDSLTAFNIRLYEQRPEIKQPRAGQKQSNPITHIDHELYFWNIIILAQQLGREEVAHLVAKQALQYYKGLRTQTALMVIYQLLKTLSGENRLASCVSLAQKCTQLIECVRTLSVSEQQYRVLNQILCTRVFLKLGMIQEATTMYMMKLGESEQQNFKETQNNPNSLPFKAYQEFLHAQIEFHSRNNNLSLKIISEIATISEQFKPRDKQLVRVMLDCNVGLVLSLNGQANIGKMMLHRASASLFALKQGPVKDNERIGNLTRLRQNKILVGLLDKQAGLTSRKQAFQQLSSLERSYSFKVNYRKAQVCLSYYHQLLRVNQKKLPWAQIHDQYDPVYYYPNQPYFQQKGKNKNPNFTNGKHFHRRYVLAQWENSLVTPLTTVHDPEDHQLQARELKEIKPVEKEKEKLLNIGKGKKNRQKKEEQEERSKANQVKEMPANQQMKNAMGKIQYRTLLKSILQEAENNLRQSFMILEEEKKVIAKVFGSEGDMTHKVNEKLYTEYVEFKGNIYALLCYVLLCRCEWLKVVRTAAQYLSFEKLHLHQGKSKNQKQKEISYSIHSYQMEALCELNRMPDSYDAMHSAISLGCQQDQKIQARSTINSIPGECYFEHTNHYNCLLYNISVLHSRDNRIAESHQSIQKMLNHMRLVPSSSQAKIPLSLVDLLIHYNLRTYNFSSAIQMIKRKRILSLQGLVAHGVHPTLSITK